MLIPIAHDDRLDLIDFLAQHADVRGSIMKIRNRSNPGPESQDDSQALVVETEHAKWWTTVDEHLSDHTSSQSIAKPHQVTLIVLRFETILALHRSILGNPKHDTVFNAALQRCVTASRSIINTLYKALKGFGAFDGSPGQHGYESTPLLWPSFTWAIWMSTFVVIFAATEKQLSRKIALGLADRSIEVLQNLALRGTNWPESCIVGIRNLVVRLKRLQDKGTSSAQSDIAGTSQSRRSEVPVLERTFTQTQRPSNRLPSPDNVGRSHGFLNLQSGMNANHRMIPQSSIQQATGLFDLHGVDQYTAVHGPINQDILVPTANHLSGSGDFLGIAQQSSDIPRPNEDITQMFSNDDLSWWMGADYGLNGLQ